MRGWRALSRAARQRTALGALVALALCTAVVWGLRDLRSAQQRREALPRQEGRMALAGLADVVSVRRDAHGVPHIEARQEADAWFALGFVHAQDRLAQMLWLRQVARGRAAESVGRRALPADRLARTLDFTGLARRDLRRLPAGARHVLERFAAGVDARLAQIRERGDRPPVDVARLSLSLDAWEPADSLAILKLQAWNRDDSVEVSLVLSDLIQHLGPAGAARFFPGSAVSEEEVPLDAQASTGSSASADWTLAAALRREAGFSGRGIGSSAWVLGGGRTASGHPILAGDLHLDPTVPAAFHLDHLRAGTLEIAGATLPGVPLFWCGHNRQVAWCAVGAPAVVVDLYVEALDPNDPTRYHDGEGWRPLDLREERIDVRGGAPVALEVRSTRNGPLLPDLENAPPLSLRWSGAQGAGSGFAALLEAASARDAESFRESLREHREPMLAVAYADASGEAGVKVAGYVPRRSLAAKLVPLQGRARWYQWRERVPFDVLPTVRLQDPQGFVVAADAPLDVRGGASVEWLWQTGARAARIDALLAQQAAAGGVGLRQVALMQADVGVERAPRIIAKALALVEGRALGAQAAEVARLLEGWDGRATRGSDGAAAYYVFLGELLEALLEERMGPDLLRRYLALPQTDPEQLAQDLLDAAQADPQAARRGGVADAIARSLRGSWLALSYRLGANARRWAWGDLHPLRFRALGAAGSGDDPMSLGPFAYGGSSATVSAAPYDFAAPFAVTTASTVRFVVDLGAPGQALAAIAPGQSEHPGEPHRDDGLRDWLEGRAWLFATDPLLVEDGSVARLDLEPVR